MIFLLLQVECASSQVSFNSQWVLAVPPRPQDQPIYDGEDKVPLRSTQHGNPTEEIAESMQMVTWLEGIGIGEVYSFWFQLLKSHFFHGSTIWHVSTMKFGEITTSTRPDIPYWNIDLWFQWQIHFPDFHVVIHEATRRSLRWSWAPIPTGFWAWSHPPKHLWNPRSLRYTCPVGVVWKGKGDDGEGGMNLVDGPSWVCDI